MITGQFDVNQTVSLVDRPRDGWSFCFGFACFRGQVVIFQPPSIDLTKKECELFSPLSMHYPSLHIRRGAPGFLCDFVVPPFYGEGS